MQHPERIGPYQIEEFLGGGMCHVYRAQDLVIEKTVAIKILTPENSRDEDAKSRFLREARMAASLNHPNCIATYSLGEDRGAPYMVMEFLRGENLGSAIKNGRTGDLQNRLSIALGIARGLEHIGSKGIVHRDIKPDNIHIDTTGVAKLIDFGISKKMVDPALTQVGMTMGTAPYMAPEQVLGKDTTHLVDVYAFGLLLFELLTGQRAIPPTDQVERIFYQILKEPLDLERLKAANIPQPLCDLVRWCTQKTPESRPQSFDVIGREIQRAIQEIDSAKEKHPRSDPRWPKWMFGAAGILALMLVGTLTYQYYPKATPAEPTTKDNPPAAIGAGNGNAERVLEPTKVTDLGEMVLVPSDAYLKRMVVDPTPSFYIDRTEVTNAAFQQYCKTLETNRPPPCASTTPPDYPVVNVTIEEARDFARWAGKRLPTLKEWERGAKGGNGYAFPWGNQRDPSRANVKDNPSGKAEIGPADAFSSGDSPWGARQMIGNVWELIDEVRHPSPDAVDNFRERLSPPASADEPWHIMMGGSAMQPLLGIDSDNAAAVPDRFRNKTIGFRCIEEVSR